jgi:hypothetical protein
MPTLAVHDQVLFTLAQGGLHPPNIDIPGISTLFFLFRDMRCVYS